MASPLWHLSVPLFSTFSRLLLGLPIFSLPKLVQLILYSLEKEEVRETKKEGEKKKTSDSLVTMKTFPGTSQLCPSLKSFSNKVGGMLCHCGSPNKYKRLDTKLERKLVEVKKGSQGVGNFKSINSIIMKFPQFKEELKKLRSVFEQCDEDSNGTIDREELNNSLRQLQLRLTEKEIDDLFHSCDIDGSEGIQFNEFIVLLCLIYLLKDQPSSSHITAKMGSPELEATFDTIIEVFLFLDKNGDGKLNKKDMVKALNDSSTSERSPAHITRNRFREMDWDRNGHVSFREFLFAFVHWVGFDTDEEIPISDGFP